MFKQKRHCLCDELLLSSAYPTEIEQKIVALINKRTWLDNRNAVHLLRENTGEGLTFDPFANPGRLLWNTIGMAFVNEGEILEALTVFQSMLQCFLDIQDKTKRRIHKGTPYHYLGRVYLKMNNLAYAREQFLLAFIEDILSELQHAQGIAGIPDVGGALDNPAPIVLELAFRMRQVELDDLYEFTKKAVSEDRDNRWLYPETILLTWRNYKDKNRDSGPLIARAVEESLFHTNTHYVRELLEKAKSDSTGRGMEELATYLFSCVDGFEAIPRMQTEAFHLDVVVRNLVDRHPLLLMLGEYIGVEAKNLTKTVNVEQLDHFIQKLRFHNMKCGVIFTSEGISGMHVEKEPKYGQLIQVKTFNRDGIIVFDVTVSDVEKIIRGDNLVSLLLAKYEDIRYK